MAAHWLPIGLKLILRHNPKDLTIVKPWICSLEVSNKKPDVLRTWFTWCMSWIMLSQPCKTMAWTIQRWALWTSVGVLDSVVSPVAPWKWFPHNSWWYDVIICEWQVESVLPRHELMSLPCHTFFHETPHITGAKLIKAGALAKSFLSNKPWREPHSWGSASWDQTSGGLSPINF